MANIVFLPTYYTFRKVNMLSNTFKNINTKLLDEYNDEDTELPNTISDDTNLAIEKLEANNSMYMYVFDIYSLWNFIKLNYYYPAGNRISENEKADVREKVQEYVWAAMGDEEAINEINSRDCIEAASNYSIYMVYDERIGSNYLELFGVLDSGLYVYCRTNYQSMHDNILISNKFIKYIGIASVCIGMLLMFFVSSEFLGPVNKITKIAKRMAKLDFDAKYEVKTQDEIGQLGNSINTLSENLETTIAELKSANNELQKDIERRTQLDEMRKDFLSNVSHELKTPIALIQGYAEGLEENINDDPESRKFYCEVIQDEARKMNNMVKKLLTLNQIEFGNDVVNYDRFDIVQVVKSVTSSAKLLSNQKEATLEIEEHDPIFVWADEYLIEEVITNYVSNAINHVDNEKIIKVYYEEEDSIVRINVFNTGKNIPEEDLEKVWIKFFKVDKARTREYGGSGIGLSIVKAIMDSHNHKYGVKNTPDGVIFWFELETK
ncbi:MAG: HAMP domain-containing histidine kinase [Lachnospiraceae bacterium]|nr:HAMP domain-containing histidine kinase [Lachnospiraceae bacterium]